MNHILHLPYGWLDPVVWILLAIVIVKLFFYIKGFHKSIFSFFRSYTESIDKRVKDQEKSIKEYHISLNDLNLLFNDVKKKTDKIEELRKIREINFAKENDAFYKDKHLVLKENHAKYHDLYQKIFDLDMSCKVSDFACERSLATLKSNFQSQELYDSYFSWSFSTFKSLHSDASDNIMTLRKIIR